MSDVSIAITILKVRLLNMDIMRSSLGLEPEKPRSMDLIKEIEDEIARYKEITELDGAYHAELNNKIKCIQEILK